MKKIIVLLILLIPLVSHSQFKTLKLEPGQTYSNKSSDTLIITTLEKIKSSVIKNRELKIALQEIDKSNEIILNLEEQNKAFEEKSNAQEEIVESYKKQIAGSETHADNLKKEVKRQKRQKFITMAGGAVLVVLALLL